MKTLLLTAAAFTGLTIAGPAAAQTAQRETVPVTAEEDLKVNQLIVYGDDPCPASTRDEITVCARRPENDRYRIPAPLRGTDRPENNSWAVRASELQYVGRTGIQSCSPVGPGGFTGCLSQFINQARAERQSADGVDWGAMVERARQERLGRIDAEADEEERSAPR
jgi:hypothetical protein